MLGSSSVIPSIDDLITSLEVIPSDVVPSLWVQGSDGLELGVTRILRLLIVSLVFFRDTIPSFLEEFLLIL